MTVEPIQKTSRLSVDPSMYCGECLLCVPETVSSNVGLSAVYPAGTERHGFENGYRQEVDPDNLFREGNFKFVSPSAVVCCGISVPVDSPAAWSTNVYTGADRIEFEIKLTNIGSRIIYKAGAAICFSFQKASWWSDARTFVYSEGRLRSLSELGFLGFQ